MRGRLLALSGVGVAAVAIGCSSGGGGLGGNGGPTTGPYGGSLALEWNVLNGPGSGYGLADVNFYTSGGTLSVDKPPLGTCVDVTVTGTPQLTLTPVPVVTGGGGQPVDAGANVQLVNGSTTITLPPFSNSTGSYGLNPQSQPPDGKYDVVIAGSTAGLAAQTLSQALVMPQLPTLPPSITLAVNGSGITWSPAGGDFAIVALSPNGNPPWKVWCYAKDEGHFTLPPNALANVPNGNGTVVVETRTQRTATLDNGRLMVLFGDIAAATSYTK